MIQDLTLRRRAQEQMRAGSLPRRRPERIWGGSSFGGCCCGLCGVAIGEQEVALEIEFTVGDEAASRNAHLHTRCFLAFELEIVRGQAEPAAPVLRKRSSSVTDLQTLRSNGTWRPDPGLPSESADTKIAPHGRVGS